MKKLQMSIDEIKNAAKNKIKLKELTTHTHTHTHESIYNQVK